MTDRPVRIKPVFWMASSRKDLKAFPKAVQSDVGYAIFAAQRGEEYRSVKALKGFGGRSVLEIVAPHDGDFVSGRLYGEVRGRGLCASRVPEEIDEGNRHASARDRLDPPSIGRR